MFLVSLCGICLNLPFFPPLAFSNAWSCLIPLLWPPSSPSSPSLLFSDLKTTKSTSSWLSYLLLAGRTLVFFWGGGFPSWSHSWLVITLQIGPYVCWGVGALNGLPCSSTLANIYPLGPFSSQVPRTGLSGRAVFLAVQSLAALSSPSSDRTKVQPTSSSSV